MSGAAFSKTTEGINWLADFDQVIVLSPTRPYQPYTAPDGSEYRVYFEEPEGRWVRPWRRPWVVVWRPYR